MNFDDLPFIRKKYCVSWDDDRLIYNAFHLRKTIYLFPWGNRVT